jgi:mannose-6-phosphate isomerase
VAGDLTLSVSLEPRPYLLANKVQHYVWGSRGPDAFIPRLLGIRGEKDRPYAELWMGTHPNAPSDVVVDGARVPLPQLLSRYPLEILGEEVYARFGGAFPFLFKVLSAAEVLSIQAHPNKTQAERLHAQDPEHYADDNHKPEIAIALDSLMALVGFRGLDEIAQVLERYPELADFVGQEVVGQLRGAERAPRDLVRLVYATLMRRSITHQEELAASIAQLSQRLRRSGDSLTQEEQIFLDVEKKYAADVGLYSIFLLKLVHLERGQGLFTGPGVPHAYLKGNIVECMATSDNVVRAGLTPKFKDVETLVDLLTYETEPVAILGGEPEEDRVVYRAPVAEFQVSRWKVKPGRERVRGNTPGILLITQGQVRVRWGAGSKGGEMALQRGQSVLVPAFLDEFELVSSDHAELFQAIVPPLHDA